MELQLSPRDFQSTEVEVGEGGAEEVVVVVAGSSLSGYLQKHMHPIY